MTSDFTNVDLGNGQITTISKLEKTDAVEAGFYISSLKNLHDKHPIARLFKSENSTGGNPGVSQAQQFEHNGVMFDPGIAKGLGWKAAAITDTGLSGMKRLSITNRLHVGDKQLGVRRYPEDFGLKAISNWWDGFGGASNPIYVVQTNEKVVERCILMCTDPGDLVLDPTCGSGTTAFVAEKSGRR